MLRFIGGYVVGLVGLGLIALILVLADGQLSNLERGTRSPIERATLTGRGADVTRHGGVDVVLRDLHLLIRQRCRGVCDDLTPSVDFRWVRVTDAKGDCVVCRRLWAAGWKTDAEWIGEGVQTTPHGGAK